MHAGPRIAHDFSSTVYLWLYNEIVQQAEVIKIMKMQMFAKQEKAKRDMT